MKLRECIIRAIKLLGLNRLIENDDIDKENEEIKAFFDMGKTILEEICSDYYPLKTRETVVADKDGIISTKNLIQYPINFYNITKDKVSYPFAVKYNCLDVGIEGKFKLEYSFLPKIKDIDDEISFSQRIGERIIAYGIAAEYCIINGLNEAETFDKKYKDALKKALITTNEKRIKERAFI